MGSKHETAGGSIRILLLSQEHCDFCEQAKDILDRLVGEYQLSISTLDIQSSEGQKLAMQGGFLFPPGVLIENEPFSYGRLSERKLRRELDRWLRSRSREKPSSFLSRYRTTCDDVQ